ncbi:MAG TPA: HEAT repeat domain-containing protein [Myxococcales bacterium]|jgi:hypothetical protein
MKRVNLAVVVSLACFLLAGAARASEPGVAELTQRVAQAAREKPDAFRAVSVIKRGVPTLDQKRRGPIAAVAPMLKALKKDAFWPLVGEVLTGMKSDEFLPSARTAWAVGVLEALGALGDAQAAPAVLQALRTESQPETVRAAAAALGQIHPDAADVLVPLATHPGPMQLPVVAALAECRTLKAAKALAGLLAETEGDEALGRTGAKALGELASSWVWQRPAYAARPERKDLAAVAAQGLLTAFLRTTGQARTVAERNLLVVDFDGTAALFEKAKAEHPEQKAELDRLSARLANNPLHDKVR